MREDTLPPARLHAVLVGVNAYADRAIPDLSFARQDAEALSDLLQSSKYHGATRVTLFVDELATRHAVLTAIGTDLPRVVSQNDVVVIYFAGHGSPELQGIDDRVSRFLVCHDTYRSSLLASAIDIGSDFPRLISRLRARLVIFITDACFSGYSGGRGIVGPQLTARLRTSRPSLRLDDLPVGEGTVFMAAASDDEVAWESEELGHGVFSFFLIRELRTAASGDVIGLSTLYDLVHREVREFSEGRQNPMLSGRLIGAALPSFRPKVI